MKRKYVYLLLISIFLFPTCTKHSRNITDNNTRLWYTYPAKYWNSQALHIGNGYMGATFFGGIQHEVITFTEASMWTGEPAEGNWEKDGVNPKAREVLPIIRDAIVNGKTHLADSLVQHDFFGKSDIFGYFTSIGELNLDFLGQDDSATNYMRELDLANSLGKISYTSGGVTYRREYFCSYPDRVAALKFSSDKPGSISFDLGIHIIQDSSVTFINGNTLEVKGLINGNHRPFDVLLTVKNTGGSVGVHDGKLAVRNAGSAVIYFTAATNYRMAYPDYTGEDPVSVTQRIMKNVASQDYESLKKKHISDYKSLFDRVKLQIRGNAEAESLPVNERYQRLKAGGSDPGYKVLAFNLGRYMIISSSRPGTLPANLQGVWNNFKSAPWAGNYQSNINLQEIYWSCGPVNLPECQQAYIDWIKDLAIPGHEIARLCYGTGGWVSHTTGNIWGHAAPYGGIRYGMYAVGAAWHCQHVWEQFAFTQDTAYLRKEAYPLLRDASVFWLENLVPFHGYLISAPAVSAEHGALLTNHGLDPAFHDKRSQDYRYNIPGVYQDVEMIHELFTNTAQAASIMGDQAFADSLLRVRDQLLPLKIGKYGQLQEWYEDIDSPECHHRHIAHLFAVYPGTMISPSTTPELAKAAETALNFRGDGRFPEQESVSGGNWARAHRMWCWTRLLDGNRADSIMTGLLTEEGFENVLTFQHIGYDWGRPEYYNEGDSIYCHFQLDASASLPGCIAEMLLQSQHGDIRLLPALPGEFATGEVKGLKARGNYTVNITWKNGDLVHADIICPEKSPVPAIWVKNKPVDPAKSDKIEIIKL